MIQKPRSKKPLIFSTICLLIVLLSGSLALFWQTHQQHSSKAMHQGTGGSIIGVPTLPAATVDKIFAQVGSPMVGTGSVVEQAAHQANIDDAFALGVWWTETNDGAAGVGRADRNPGSVRGSYGYPAAYDGYTIYPSYTAAITDWFNVLKSRYVSRGLTSVYTLCYSYVGTSSAPLWAAKVVNLMYRYRGEAPPVTVTPTPKLQPTATLTTSPQTPINNRARQLATRLAQRPDNMVSPDSTTPIQIPQQTVQQASQPSSLSSPSTTLPLPVLPLVCFGLLAALAIALAGLRIGREATVPEPALTMEAESVMSRVTTGNAASFITSNTAPQPHYTPITEALSPFFTQEQVPQLDFPSFPSIFQPTMFQQFSVQEEHSTPIPASPGPQQTSIPDLPTLPAANITDRGGLLKRYGTTEALGRRTILSPSRLRPIPESEEEPSPHTETLREPAPVPVAGGRYGGLLQRYTQQ